MYEHNTCENCGCTNEDLFEIEINGEMRTVCRDCGRLIPDGEANWDNSNECYYCDDCYENHASSLNGYSYKPVPQFQFRTSELKELDADVLEPRSAIHTFGVELEVDDGDDASDLCEALEELDQPIYMKHDGSLNSEGVEIVTHPCSLAYHQYEMRWAEIMRVCDSRDYKSHDTTTCGLHIHVGRSSTGATGKERDAVAGNLVILTNAVWDELVTFSRRKGGALDHWARRPNLRCDPETLDDAQLTDYALYTENDGRYQAVNLTNHGTVEFRLFRGTLKRKTLIAALQLVNNMVDYAMTHTPKECLTAKWSDIVAVKQFKELNAYCESRGL